MPTCHRCTRTFASADVRRTPKGHVCKDTDACKRRLNLTVNQLIDDDRRNVFAKHGEDVDRLTGGCDPILALTAFRRLHEDTTEMVGEICERALKETKLTKKALADALGVPVSMFRGL
jgi:hypothetical protein